MPSALTPWNTRRALRCRSAFSAADSFDAAATMRAASFSVSFVDRPSTAANKLLTRIRVGGLRGADGLRLTGRDLAGLQRLERVRRRLDRLRGLQQAHRRRHTHAGDVIEPVRRRAVTRPSSTDRSARPDAPPTPPPPTPDARTGRTPPPAPARHEHPSDPGSKPSTNAATESTTDAASRPRLPYRSRPVDRPVEPMTSNPIQGV